jgi:hypothetical protein
VEGGLLLMAVFPEGAFPFVLPCQNLCWPLARSLDFRSQHSAVQAMETLLGFEDEVPGSKQGKAPDRPSG